MDKNLAVDSRRGVVHQRRRNVLRAIALVFRLVPGVPETGPFNAHLVADSGTFFIAVGVGLLIAGFDPRRHVVAVVVAAIANLFHSILHIYSHEAGLLSLDHLGTEVIGIYLPTVLLIAMAIYFARSPAPRDVAATARAA